MEFALCQSLLPVVTVTLNGISPMPLLQSVDRNRPFQSKNNFIQI